MISTADVLDLIWSETERDDPPPQDYLPREVEDAFVVLLREVPSLAPLLYEPRHGLDAYVRAWLASIDMNPRWAAALYLRYGLITGNPMGWTRIGRRLGVSRQAAQKFARNALAELWQRYGGRRGENLHMLREEATAALAEPGHGGSHGTPEEGLGPTREGLWNPVDPRTIHPARPEQLLPWKANS